jgi:hypothetical protein
VLSYSFDSRNFFICSLFLWWPSDHTAVYGSVSMYLSILFDYFCCWFLVSSYCGLIRKQEVISGESSQGFWEECLFCSRWVECSVDKSIWSIMLFNSDVSLSIFWSGWSVCEYLIQSPLLQTLMLILEPNS